MTLSGAVIILNFLLIKSSIRETLVQWALNYSSLVSPTFRVGWSGSRAVSGRWVESTSGDTSSRGISLKSGIRTLARKIFSSLRGLRRCIWPGRGTLRSFTLAISTHCNTKYRVTLQTAWTHNSLFHTKNISPLQAKEDVRDLTK